MRKMVAAMQTSLDARVEGPDGYADWVDAWSDTYDIISEADACVLGAGMYPGYEAYWEGISRDPTARTEPGDHLPTPGEIAYARFARSTPHYVLSTTLTSTAWPETSFLRDLDQLRALKLQSGGTIYVVGGAMTVATLIDLGLIEELRLTLHPLIAGPGKRLFDHGRHRHRLDLRHVEVLDAGRISLRYAVAN